MVIHAIGERHQLCAHQGHSWSTFKAAFPHRRGILMVHTFNEGEELQNTKISLRMIGSGDSQPIAIAVSTETATCEDKWARTKTEQSSYRHPRPPRSDLF